MHYKKSMTRRSMGRCGGVQCTLYREGEGGGKVFADSGFKNKHDSETSLPRDGLIVIDKKR